MRKADVPVPYIIAIIIGIAVIALLGYWFFMTGGGFLTEVSEQGCRTLKSRFCSAWAVYAYQMVNDKGEPVAVNAAGGIPKIGEWDLYGDGKGRGCRDNFNTFVDSKDDCTGA